MAVSELQQEYGRWSWRWRAPLADRLALDRLPAQLVTLGAAGERAFGEIRDDGGDELMTVARQLQHEVEREGIQMSRDRLGRRLRERGFTIANYRLTELIAAVREESARRGSS
ncbi:hypothetical protein [Actinomadura rubrisoli]|uniref:Uncharacterized protein n=1 Tax=Actinomadura rubrisoli TaxID=2530368 RepID=A0A4R5AHF7_9ACTN|nr:hypothetical protein [Actinomadura rubrisoli]TDD71115.1 hypothetical protein E1298_36155 [Actinomadura rubrisoli]